MILIMTEQVLSFNVFFKKDPHLNVVERFLFWDIFEVYWIDSINEKSKNIRIDNSVPLDTIIRKIFVECFGIQLFFLSPQVKRN